MDCTAHGILQARILEWAAFPFCRGSSQPRDRTQISRTAGRFFTSWATREAQERWSGQPIPSPPDLPDRGIEPGSPALQADSLPAELHGEPLVNPTSCVLYDSGLQPFRHQGPIFVGKSFLWNVAMARIFLYQMTPDRPLFLFCLSIALSICWVYMARGARRQLRL